MDKFKVIFFQIFGSSLLSFAVRVFLAGAGLVAGSNTNVGDAIGQALDKQRSIAVCVQAINDTPKEEVIEAVKAENAEAVAQ